MSKQLKINFDTNEIVEAVKENSLYNWCIKNNRKDLLDEWNYELNGDTNPKNITPKNGKKVWWICSVDKRHVWDAAVAHRTNGTGCPYCTGQKIKPGINDLFTTNPELKIEWDFDKNCDDPTQLSKGNDSKKYWWKCSKCGFEWDAVIYSRTTLHTGCPNCGREKRWSERMGKLVAQKGSILDEFPKVIENEWDYILNEKEGLRPNEIVANSNKKAWWICQCCGEPYKQVIDKKLHDNLGHNECARDRRTSMPEKLIAYYLKKYFDIEENYRSEDIDNKEIDIYIPSLKLGIEYDGDAWHRDITRDLEKDKILNAKGIILVRVREGECDCYDSTSIQIHCDKNYSSLKSMDYVMNEIEKIINNYFNLSIDFDCNIERDYSMILNMFLSSRKDNSIEKDIELLKYWSYERNGNVKPFMLSLGSNKTVWWECPICKNAWQQKVYAMANKKRKCTNCYNICIRKAKV